MAVKVGFLADAVENIPARRKIDITGNFDEAASGAARVDGIVRGIPTHKVVNIVVRTRYEGERPDQDRPGTGYQHGGQFTVRGPAGPDKVPVAFRATAGEVVTVTPPGMPAPPNPNPGQVNNYNLAIHTSAPAEAALSDFAIMRTLAGV